MLTVFEVGESYTRNDIYELLNVPKERRRGNWETGYTSYNGANYIFVNIGTTGRSGPDHNDRWLDNGDLLWHGKKGSHKNQPSIKRMISGNKTHVFYRVDNKDTRFVYKGIGSAVKVTDDKPVEVIWSFAKELTEDEVRKDIDLEQDDEYEVQPQKEGTKRVFYTTRYERNPKLRSRAIKLHGTKCMACGFDFSAMYGERGENYIEVHHVKPLSEYCGETEIDPNNDLVVVCSNCHRMIHRKRTDVLSIDQLKKIICQ